MDDFNDILDCCVQEVRTGRATYEACAARYPDQAEQIRVLLPVAVRLASAPPINLPAERRAAIEARLLERVAQLPVRITARSSRPAARPIWRRAWSMVAAMAMLLCLVGWGVTSASAASLPGDPLYPVKRFTEELSLSLASAGDQPHLQVQMASHRLDEYTTLSARGEVKPDLIVEASTGLAAVLSNGDGSASQPDQAAVEEVLTAVDVHWQTLQGAVAQAPNERRSEVSAALSHLATSRERALGVLASRFPDSALLHANGRIPITATPTATSEPTNTPTATATITFTPTSTPTAVPTVEPSETANAKTTPPGLINTPKPKITPPGLVNTPKPKNTPPGLEKTPKPKEDPPGKDK